MYLLFWPAFILWIFLEKKKSMRCLLNTKWLMKKAGPKWHIFIRHFDLRRQRTEFFFTKKIVKWKQVKITNMILQRLQVLQVFPYILRREITKIWRNLHFYLKLLTLLRSVKKKYCEISFHFCDLLRIYELITHIFNFWPSYTDFLWKNSMHCLHWSCL